MLRRFAEITLMSNTDKNGNLDYKGMMPEQIQGFGLGIMYARALYHANQMKGENNFRENGRVYGTNGRGVVIANDIHNYDEQISEDLTQKAADANICSRISASNHTLHRQCPQLYYRLFPE